MGVYLGKTERVYVSRRRYKERIRKQRNAAEVICTLRVLVLFDGYLREKGLKIPVV